MKKYSVEYAPHPKPGPMTFWVHIAADGLPWYRATAFEPPIKPVQGKGYPHYYVEYDNFVFEFSSLDEMDVCIATLSQKNLPPTEKETSARGTGPASHWLNRLPGRVKSWHYRSRAVKYLKAAREAFEKEALVK